jgi:hypothetical protein
MIVMIMSIIEDDDKTDGDGNNHNDLFIIYLSLFHLLYSGSFMVSSTRY